MPASSFEYVLPVIRGIQAGREYYVSMCPVRLLPKLFPISEEEVPAPLRSQRSLNKNRAQEMSRYILDNLENYTVSAITASIDAEIEFEPMGSEKEARKLGRLRVPMDARFIINDGHHRRVAYELALKENPDLGYETVAVVFFLDLGLQRSQQIFHDLNALAMRPEPALNLLYNHRESAATLMREVIKAVPVFRSLTEMERSTISRRSGKLFMLSHLYQATLALLANRQGVELGQQIKIATEFWQIVSDRIQDWQWVLQRRLCAWEVRRDYVHTHPMVLAGIASVGASILAQEGQFYREQWAGLAEIDWSYSNPDWEGILNAGKGSIAKVNVQQISSYITKFLSVPVSLK